VEIDGVRAVAGLLVGVVVGISGVGGGSLMTPILVLMFGIAPQTAVGTDLLVASITKSFGVAVHHNHGTVDWGIVRRLAYGSVPAAFATLAWMHFSDSHQVKSGFIITAVAIALIITSLGMVLKDWLHRVGRSLRVTDESYFKHFQVPATVFAGVMLGVLVTLTSIGAGALGTVMLVYLYPMRLTPSKLVGTDLAHAIPIALIAGLGHLSLGNVNYSLLGNLLLGSIPGVLIGSVISTRAPMKFIRYAIAITLGLVAMKMFTI
jgi:uncharacterized membrane protein YfcA